MHGVDDIFRDFHLLLFRVRFHISLDIALDQAAKNLVACVLAIRLVLAAQNIVFIWLANNVGDSECLAQAFRRTFPHLFRLKKILLRIVAEKHGARGFVGRRRDESLNYEEPVLPICEHVSSSGNLSRRIDFEDRARPAKEPGYTNKVGIDSMSFRYSMVGNCKAIVKKGTKKEDK
jgi:hypothetical protein